MNKTEQRLHIHAIPQSESNDFSKAGIFNRWLQYLDKILGSGDWLAANLNPPLNHFYGTSETHLVTQLLNFWSEEKLQLGFPWTCCIMIMGYSSFRNWVCLLPFVCVKEF